MSHQTQGRTPIACRMGTLSPAQRERRSALQKQLHAAGLGARELADGYAFHFSAEPSTIIAAAEFISLERLCCPFFRFELTIEAETDTLWLRLTGREGVKDFSRMELAP